MCIFSCRRNSDKSRIWMICGQYEMFNCNLCKNQQNLKKLQFCGKFSVCYDQLQQHWRHIATQLLNLQKKSNYLQCKKCQSTFYLDRKDDHLFISTFTCLHSQKQINKTCKLCRKLVQKKLYKKCKKCSLSLCFLDMSRRVKCPNCKIVYCEYCQQEQELFSQKQCNCQIIKFSKYLLFYEGLVILIIVKIILVIILSSYFEESDYFKSMICTIKDGYSNENCTMEQLFKDTFKQIIIFIGFGCVSSLGIAIIESIKMVLKYKSKLLRAKCQKY